MPASRWPRWPLSASSSTVLRIEPGSPWLERDTQKETRPMAMIGATLAQLRFTASLVFGWPFDLRALDRLVDAMQDTQREFGAVGPDAGDLLGGPTLDDDTRREV